MTRKHKTVIGALVGALVAFLVSEQTDYMTGTCIAIDGGAIKTIT